MDVQEQLEELRNRHNSGHWIFKHVNNPRADDIQTNDAATNTLVYMRRITLSEAEEIVKTDNPKRPRIVILPPTSLIVRTLKRKGDYGY